MIHAVREDANPYARAIHAQRSSGHVGLVGYIALARIHLMLLDYGFLLWSDRPDLG
jgi:hypothetical protein